MFCLFCSNKIVVYNSYNFIYRLFVNTVLWKLVRDIETYLYIYWKFCEYAGLLQTIFEPTLGVYKF